MATNAAKPSWMVKSGMMKLLRHGAWMLGGRETLAMFDMLEVVLGRVLRCIRGVVEVM